MTRPIIDLYIINSTFPLILSLEKIYNKKKNNFKILFLKNRTHQSLENYLIKKFTKKHVISFSNSYFGQINLILTAYFYNIFFKVEELYIGTIAQRCLFLIFNFLLTKRKIILSDGTDSISFYWSGKRFLELHGNNKKKINLLSIFNLNKKFCNNFKINLQYFSDQKELVNDSLLILGGRYMTYKKTNEIFSILKQIIDYHKNNYGINNFYYKPHPYELESPILKKIFEEFKFLILYRESDKLPIEIDYKNSKKFPKFVTSDNLIPTTSFFTLTQINNSIISNIIEVQENKFINDGYFKEYKDIVNYIYSFKNKNFNFVKIL